MPYVSTAQRGWAHTPAAKKAGFPTAEYDRASKGQKDLPEHYHKKKKKSVMHQMADEAMKRAYK
jgi:hypothetical protein